MLLVQPARATGLGRGLSRALGRWRPLTAVRDPGRRRGPTGPPVPPSGPVIVDLDATVIVSHSPDGERCSDVHADVRVPPVAGVRRPRPGRGRRGAPRRAAAPGQRQRDSPASGRYAGATDHISVLDLALAQLPGAVRSRVVVRADSGGGTKAFLTRITNLGSGYSIGIGTAIGVDQQLLTRRPTAAWTQAYDPDRKPAGRRAGHRADRDAALADRPRLAAISARATQQAVHAPAWALHDRVRS